VKNKDELEKDWERSFPTYDLFFRTLRWPQSIMSRLHRETPAAPGLQKLLSYDRCVNQTFI